jgi:hypothetical protein
VVNGIAGCCRCFGRAFRGRRNDRFWFRKLRLRERVRERPGEGRGKENTWQPAEDDGSAFPFVIRALIASGISLP